LAFHPTAKSHHALKNKERQPKTREAEEEACAVGISICMRERKL
jgi:hypothetical protein